MKQSKTSFFSKKSKTSGNTLSGNFRPLFNSIAKNGIPNSVEKYRKTPFPSKIIADILNASIEYLQENDELAKNKFISALKKQFIKKNKETDDVSVFAEAAFDRAKRYCADVTDENVKILHFETSIIRSLNEKVEMNIELPIITYIRDLCVSYREHLEKDMSRNEEGELIMNNGSSFDTLTYRKHQMIVELERLFSSSNKCRHSNQDILLEEFKEQLIKTHDTLSETRDPWYMEFAKQLFSLGLINLYRYIYKGEITRGDKLFNSATLVVNSKVDTDLNFDAAPQAGSNSYR